MSERSNLQEPRQKLLCGVMGILLVYAAIRGVVEAAGKSFWYDEMLTLIVSAQGNWEGIVRALRVPADGQPPLFHLIEHFASGVTHNQEIALRLPSIAALLCTLACVFVYVKRHSGELVGLICTGFLLMSEVFQHYPAEARPYSMVVACIAFALVCYQRVPSPLWTVLLGVSLAFAQSLHYLAVLAMIPFGVAEAVFLLKTKKFRWQVWLALAAGELPLLVFWPLLMTNKAYYGTHFWARMKLFEIPGMYGQFFETDSKIGAGIGAVILAGILARMVLQQREVNENTEEQSQNLAEGALLFVLALLPLLAYFLIVQVAHSGLTARYVLPAVVGMAAGFGYLLEGARSRVIGLCAVFVLAAVGVHELHFWRFLRSDIENVHATGQATERILEHAGRNDLAVIVPDGTLLLPLAHYISPSFAVRFVYVTRDPASINEQWADTVDKGFEALRPYSPIPVSSLVNLISTHRKFLIYVEQKDWNEDWLPIRLRREGWTVQVVAEEEYRKVYLATAGDGRSAGK